MITVLAAAAMVYALALTASTSMNFRWTGLCLLCKHFWRLPDTCTYLQGSCLDLFIWGQHWPAHGCSSCFQNEQPPGWTCYDCCLSLQIKMCAWDVRHKPLHMCHCTCVLYRTMAAVQPMRRLCL